MVMPKRVCPYGLKSLDLLKREGYRVEDHYLETREETEAFMAKHSVDTTPQTFVGDTRIGGYDDLRVYLGKDDADASTTYRPVIALFSMTLLMALQRPLWPRTAGSARARSNGLSPSACAAWRF